MEDEEKNELEVELLERPVDMDEVKRTKRDSMLKAGTYRTEPPMRVTVRLSKDEDEALGRRRTFLSAFGDVVLGDVHGKITFGVSPDRKNKLDADGEDTGKPDYPSRLYAQLATVYEAAAGVAAVNLGELKNFLESYPVRLRIGQGNDDNMVFSISQAKE